MKKKFDEKLWIKSLKKTLEKSRHSMHLDLEDDLAHLKVHSHNVLWSTDMLMENVDFLLKNKSDFFWAGYKSLGVNLSDLAGKGCEDIIGCLISLSWPRHYSFEESQFFRKGLMKASKLYNCPILGGDTNVWSQDLCVSVSILGTKSSSAPKCIDGRKGDYLFVTGALGGSIYGKHRNFVPRLELGKYLCKNFHIHAMTDISDGLASEIKKICKASKLGAILFEDKIPIAEILQKKHRVFQTQLQHAFCDGEDFELLFSVASNTGKKIISSCQTTKILKNVVHIGFLTNENKIFLENKQGTKTKLSWEGYVHK